MTQTATALEFSRGSFDILMQQREEPDWLVARRRDEWRRFEEMSWPSRKEEEWLRTDIRLFKLNNYSLPIRDENEARTPGDLSAAVLGQGVELAGTSVAFNSRAVGSEFGEKWSQRGVVFGSLEQLLREHSELIRPHLMTRAFDSRYDRFAALHAACWSGGHFLYVPKGVVVDEPFHVMSLLGDGAVDLGHTLVILEEGAEATFMEESASLSESNHGFHCGGTELLLAPDSHLRYVNLQDWGKRTWHFSQQKAIVDRAASIQWTIGALGARLAKVNQHVSLIGEDSESQVNGVLFAEGTQHLSYHTLQHHVAANCRSDFLYKAALQDKSRTVWRGMIKVDPNAQHTDGYQRNDNLLLSSTARADSIPGLEIEADEVRCTHGSTSGKVNEEMLFYACCRGFTRQEAIRLIVTGFFQQIFDRITIESVREALTRAIARRIREYS